MNEFLSILSNIQVELERALPSIAQNLFAMLSSTDKEEFWHKTEMQPLPDGSGFAFTMVFTTNEDFVIQTAVDSISEN